MKKLSSLSLCLGCVFAVSTSHAADLKQSKVTQVVNDVQIISASDQQQKSAAVNDLFYMPDILRTGAASRAELVAPDETVTRVGANTIFSFDPATRTIDLKQGSLLFHSPHGKGGGTIHTGSATASVLGSTLEVTTTDNGGFKALALEDDTTIRLPNGLKQVLKPGEMTFILTNGTQLAPIIVFRLDELTQNSLLIKGFAQPLASLPLIQNQIDAQLKLINSGKATDTGLDVGGDANANQIQVLDVNTVVSSDNKAPPPPGNNPPGNNPPPPPPPGGVPSLSAAEGLDATISQPSLTGSSIPTPPDRVFTDPAFSLTGNGYFGGQTFEGFVALDIFVNTSPVVAGIVAHTEGEGPAPLIVDLSPYTSVASFSLVAVNDFYIEGSVTFAGLAASDDLSLIAGNQFSLTPGISVEADVDNFTLASPATLTLDDVKLLNSANNITLNSGGDVSILDNSLVQAANQLNVNPGGNFSSVGSHLKADSVNLKPLNGGVTLDSTLVDATGHVIIIAPNPISIQNSTVINSPSVTMLDSGDTAISINNSTINASSVLTAVTGNSITVAGSTLNSDAGAGAITLIASSGSVNITGTSLTAHYLTVNSGDGILLDASGQTLTATGSGATASFNAANTLAVNNANFSSFGVVNMAANTINLFNVAFGAGSTVTLESLYGVLAPSPNTGATSVPGDVNFISGVTYGGNPAQNYVNNGGGITVTTRF